MATDPVVLEATNRFGPIGESKMTGIICRAETSGLFVRAAALIEALAAHCSALAAGCREGRQIATRYHELSQLSGADLARRGLTRQSIARVALNLQCSTSGVKP
jgi:hypothetical protein